MIKVEEKITFTKIESTYEVFNIRDDIKYGEMHDIILALGISYYHAHETRLEARDLNEFFGIKLKSNFGMVVIRTAMRNRVRFPIEWNSLDVAALKHMMEFIHYDTVIDKLEVFE